MPLAHIEGKYEILTKLSEGGMGAIYKVRHRLLDEVRVVKVMRPHLAGDAELSERFRREARTAIRLKHPSIAEIHDFALDPEGTAYIVMEFIEGHTLEHILRTSGPPPIGLTLEIGRQVLDALAFLHEKGFVHRDISPDNLMLTVDPQDELRVKIIDLGIAKTLTDDRGLTATGMFLGKLRYAAPEGFSAAGAAAADARSDLYSFGVVLYEMLTGSFPIIGEDQPALVAGHLFHPPRSFEETDPGGTVAEELRQIVLDALAKKPDERIPDARVFAKRLQGLAGRYPLDQTSAGRTLVGASPAAPSASEVGSTQDRLDHQFGAGTTPALPPTPAVSAARPAATDTAAERARAGVLLEKAQTLANGGHLSEAEKELEKAMRLAPENSKNEALRSWLDEQRAAQHAQAARQQLDADRPTEALEAARRALDLRPEHGEARALVDQAEQSLAERESLACATEEVIDRLEAGALDDAEHRLEAMRSHLGDATVLHDLSARIDAARAQQRARTDAGVTASLPAADGAQDRRLAPPSATAAAEPTIRAAGLGQPPPRRRLDRLVGAWQKRRGLIVAVLLATLVVAATWWLWPRLAAPRTEPSATTATGILVLDARPWAEITRLSDPRGQTVALAEHARFTPVALTLAPGTYAVALRHPAASEAHRFSIQVKVGEITRPPAPALAPASADTLLSELGL